MAAAVAQFHGVEDVEHLVIEDELNDQRGDIGRVEQAVEDDGVVGRVESGRASCRERV